jgi:4-diphosphocytidyl-2-C-methyl-D-erythritol kinase
MIDLRAYCKINLGLRVVRRRTDGFHDIETVMVAVPGLFDTVSVEALSAPTAHSATSSAYHGPQSVFTGGSALATSGLDVDCPPEKNICMKALRLVQREYGVGEARMRLHKAVPSGAGLGGGSADGAAVLVAANAEFALGLSTDELEGLAARLGSDVPFFVRHVAGHGGAQLCTGRGELMTPVEVDLAGMWLAVVKPSVAVSTAEAYAGVTPREEGASVAGVVRRPVSEWRELLRNDFEDSVFAQYPELGEIKEALYGAGALYASMSGSGSAMFGLFDRHPDLSTLTAGTRAADLFVYTERL